MWQIKISHFVPEGAIEGCLDGTRSMILKEWLMYRGVLKAKIQRINISRWCLKEYYGCDSGEKNGTA